MYNMSIYLYYMPDEKLYFLCKKYGEIAVRYRNKFAGLLPEVFRRRLYEKKGFSSIFEFAAKLAGMNEEQVRRVLNLERRFETMPVLRDMLVNGEVSVSKLTKVASIATAENQEDLARQARLLPRSALETLVRDEKAIQKPKTGVQSVPGNTHLLQNLESASESGINGSGIASSAQRKNPAAALSELHFTLEVYQKLLELQQKGININALLLEFLEKRELEIAQEKEALASECQSIVQHSRYIPARIRAILTKEYGTKCSVKHCKKPAEEIHHTQRFSLSQNHNPQFLASLCREHHVIAHSIDMKFHNQRFQKRPP